MKKHFTLFFCLLFLFSHSQENCDINQDIYIADSSLVVERLGKFFNDINDLLEAEEEELKAGLVKDLLDYFPSKQASYKKLGSVYIKIPDNSRSYLSVSPFEFFETLKSSRKTESSDFLSLKATINKNQVSKLLVYPTYKDDVNLPYCIIVPCDITIMLNKKGIVKSESQKVDFYFRYNKCDLANKEPKIFLIKNDPQFKVTLIQHKIYSMKEYAERNSKYEPYIRINVEPSDAILTLDNNSNIKNNELVKVSEGNHTIKASFRNYFDKSITISAIKSDKPVEASIKLEKKEGTITFACNDSRHWGKKIYLRKNKNFFKKNFDLIGTLPLNNYKLPFGQYQFLFERDDCYSPNEEEVKPIVINEGTISQAISIFNSVSNKTKDDLDIKLDEGNSSIIYSVNYYSKYYVKEQECQLLRKQGKECYNNCPYPKY